MITGVFTALVIVLSQFFFFQEAGDTKKLVKTEKQEQKSKTEKKACISLPSFSQSASAHAEVNQKSSLYLFDIFFGDVKKEDRSAEIPVFVGKFFRTLFRVFISPNAP